MVLGARTSDDDQGLSGTPRKDLLADGLEFRVILGAFLGLIGIVLVFWKEVTYFQTQSENIQAAALAILDVIAENNKTNN